MNKSFAKQISQQALENLGLHGSCKAFVASHEKVAGDMGPGRYDLSLHVVGCEVQDTLQGSTANLTLLPLRPYTDWIFPGDWISIYLSSGTRVRSGFGVVGMEERENDDFRVFFGTVSAIREQLTVDQEGKTTVRYSISCVGLKGMFEKTAIYYNKALGPNSLFGAMLPGLATLAVGIPLQGTPATIPRSIALAYMGFGGQLQMPDSYPNGFGTTDQRQKRVIDAVRTAIAIEEILGFLQVRGATGRSQKTPLLKKALKSLRDSVQANSLAAIVDFFTYVEDMFVDGNVTNTATNEKQGSIWGLMMENCNPIMNEMFFSLLPDRDATGKLSKFRAQKDEWGMSPKMTPRLVLRERPFSWSNDEYLAPSATFSNSQTTSIQFGDVFFSQRDGSTKFRKLQGFDSRQVNSAQAAATPFVSSGGGFGSQKDFEKLAAFNALSQSVRGMDRIKISAKDIQQHALGLSDNDLFNFYMISQTKNPLSQAHQKFTLLLDGLIPIFLPESIRRHGLRVRDMTTKFMYTGGGTISNKKSLDFMVRCLMAYDVWYQNQASYRAGTISCRPIPAARPGMALDVEWPNREETFYVEGVNHSFLVGENGIGMLSTNLTVTRGQPSGFTDPSYRFPYAPPDSVKIARVDPITGKKTNVSRKAADKQPTVSRSRLITEQDRVNAYANSVLNGDSTNFAAFQAELNKTKKEKQTLIVARNAYKKVASTAKLKQIDELYKKEDAKFDQPPVYPLRVDRQNAGRSVWGRRKWNGVMFSGARKYSERYSTKIANAFLKGGK